MNATVTDQFGRTHTLPGPWKNLAEIKRANKAADGHWFDRPTVAFFRTKFETVPSEGAGRLFVTSEQGPDNVRRFTVRVASDQGRIAASHHGFQAFKTKEAAVRAIEKEIG